MSIVPLQGIALRPHTLYAAVVLTTLRDATGAALGVSAGMGELQAGKRPAGMNDAGYLAYTRAIGALGKANIALSNVAGLAAFTTDAPMAGLALVKNDMLSRPAPLPSAPFALTDTFPTYCVYQSTLDMPEYQVGTPPYATTGGRWAFDAMGKPVVQRTESARIVVTVPRAAMPVSGFPVTVFVRAGGGGDRPLIDRGVQATATGPAIEPGMGPALYFARQGIAGVSVEGPLGGSRNPTGGDEDSLIFNIFNPVAERDNIRQSGAELILLAHALPGLVLDASTCPGVTGGPVVLDTTKLALMAHSLGSTIAPLAMAFEPAYRAAILSGAGASSIANIIYKLKPIPFRPTFETLLGYTRTQRILVEGDPIVTLFQWATEASDPLVYTRGIVQEPAKGESARHILMEQGIVDHYIMPPIANAMSLSLGLDLAGDELDSRSMELANLTPLSAVLSFAGRRAITLPASANAGGSSQVTSVLVQHPEDGITDGHEIVFQTDPPKREYECFLATFLKGTPIVVNGNLPDGGTQDARCP
ncbi:MAG: hypothetical protein M3O46_22565 [Myxococcota bacterium]|nr:hypothetical protein [Myxococcota bacterium]